MILRDLAHSRAGDKGNTSSLSLIAFDPADYVALRTIITPDRVKAHFAALGVTEVTRHDLPGLSAMNFVMKNALAGGVTRSLALDAHGKSLSSVFLAMELDPAEVAAARAGG